MPTIGHGIAIDGQGVRPFSVCAANAIAIAVIHGQGVASLVGTKLGGGHRDARLVGSTRHHFSAGGVGQKPADFGREGIQYDGQCKRQTVSDAGPIVYNHERVVVARGAVGTTATGAVVSCAHTAQVKVTARSIVERRIRIVVTGCWVCATFDHAAYADVLNRDVGVVAHVSAGGISIDKLNSPVTIASQSGSRKVDRSRVLTVVAHGPVFRPQLIVAKVRATGSNGL